MQITLDKLEESILENLKEKTGKSEEDIIKLALYELSRSMGNVQEAQPLQPFPVPFPSVPVNPIYPQPWPQQPEYPNPWDVAPWIYPYKITCTNKISMNNSDKE